MENIVQWLKVPLKSLLYDDILKFTNSYLCNNYCYCKAEKTWLLGYPMMSSIFAPFYYVHFKRKKCILKIMKRGSLSAVYCPLNVS